MKVQHYTDTPAESYPGTPGVSIRWVITKDDGAPNFAMRVIDVEAGYATPLHEHDFEHEVFVLAGEGVIVQPDGETPIAAGTIALVPPMETHQFVNRGDTTLRFICLVPNSSY
jgi:quercetin dioxygenase-like cupin family protein